MIVQKTVLVDDIAPESDSVEVHLKDVTARGIEYKILMLVQNNGSQQFIMLTKQQAKDLKQVIEARLEDW